LAPEWTLESAPDFFSPSLGEFFVLFFQVKLEVGKNGQGRNHWKEEKDEAVRKPP
jgi:hypothetical protein